MKRVLIANRGEVAIRIAQTLRELGVGSVGVYPAADAGSAHLGAVDRAEQLPDGGEEGDEPGGYLDVDAVIGAARRAGADSIHPGYGFLAENAAAAEAVEAAGLTWIGPPPEAIRLLGDKAAAKRTASAAGAPVLPGIAEEGGGGTGDAKDSGAGMGNAPEAGGLSMRERVIELAAEHGYPLMVKAAAGGGGKGMRRIDREAEIESGIEAARREALAAFGSGGLLVERLVDPARHIEVQIAVDSGWSAVSLGERECSLQRRHQKLIEEAPSPALTPELRERIERAALGLAWEAGYRNLGTVEFLVDAEDPERFYFLEMNARLQVEHPVTELVTDLDLVAMQVAIARGETVEGFIDGESPTAEALIAARGGTPWETAAARRAGRPRPGFPLPGRHAVEARICAERPAEGFLPATGTVTRYAEPGGPRFGPVDGERGVRTDSGIGPGSEVTAGFDPMLAKLIAVAPSRDAALGSLRGALAELVVFGVETNTGFLSWLLDRPEVRDGDTTVATVEELAEAGEHRRDLSAGTADRLRRAAAACAAAAVSDSRERRSGQGRPVGSVGGDSDEGDRREGAGREDGPGRAGFGRPDAWRIAGGAGWGHWRVRDADGTTHQLAARPAATAADAEEPPQNAGKASADAGLSPDTGPSAAAGAPSPAAPSVANSPRPGAEGVSFEVAIDRGDPYVVAPVDEHLVTREEIWVQGPRGPEVFALAGYAGSAEAAASGSLTAQLPGVVLAVHAEPGARVEEGQPLLTLESMKMELEIAAPAAGTIAELSISPGDHVERGKTLAVVEPE